MLFSVSFLNLLRKIFELNIVQLRQPCLTRKALAERFGRAILPTSYGEDKKRQEIVENRNKLDELIYRTDKSFKEFKDKLSDDEKKELTDALEHGKNAIKGENLSEIQQAHDRITKASYKIAELMYKQSQGEEGAAQAADASGAAQPTDEGEEAQQQDQSKKEGGDDVIDAEFTEK